MWNLNTTEFLSFIFYFENNLSEYVRSEIFFAI